MKKRTRREISQLSILAALNGPMPPKKREYVGWFVPNSEALRSSFRNIQKTPGKRIAVEALDNGPVKFFAEDV